MTADVVIFVAIVSDVAYIMPTTSNAGFPVRRANVQLLIDIPRSKRLNDTDYLGSCL